MLVHETGRPANRSEQKQREFGMKRISSGLILTVAIAVALGAHAANAQIISWGLAQNIVGDTDVSTLGTLLDAGTVNHVNDQFGNPLPITALVNGVPFSYLTNASGSPATDSYGKISVAFANFAGTGVAGLSIAYGTILNFAYYGGPGTSETVTLTGLLTGHQYLVEYWANNPTTTSGAILSGLPSVTLLGDRTGSGALGQFAIGTFTAINNNDVSFTYSETGSNFEILNAIQLRDLSAVPEPGTWICGALVAAVLVGRERRRLRKSSLTSSGLTTPD